jgi:hypothetical protein
MRFIFDQKNYWHGENYLRENVYGGKGHISLELKAFVPVITGEAFQTDQLLQVGSLQLG